MNLIFGKKRLLDFGAVALRGGRFKKQIKAKRLHVIFKCHNVSDERAVRYMDVLVNLVRGSTQDHESNEEKKEMTHNRDRRKTIRRGLNIHKAMKHGGLFPR